MTDKPEALRLADALDAAPYSCGCTMEAAAELRRLHAENEALRHALHSISLASKDSGSTREGMGLFARAAIARAEGKQ